MTSKSVKKLRESYRHLAPVILYLLFYLAVFTYVENRPVHNMHLLVSKWDRLIPFCEYFVVPYFLWFFYIAAGVLWFALAEKDRSQYWALVTNLGIGMTLFLIVSLVYPNGHTLRPTYLHRDNIFMDMVRFLWTIDTPTNVLPSIHVFNSVAVHIAVAGSPTLREKHPWVVHCSLLLCIAIIAATMFLKQHTVIDVITALGLNIVCYYFVYQSSLSRRETSARVRGRLQ